MIRFLLDHEMAADTHLCSFGVTELIVGALTSIGVGAETAAIAAPALLGAGSGALVSGVTGGNPLYGALGGAFTGGLTGAFGGAGGALDTATGGVLGSVGSDALIGAGVGTIGSALEGGNLFETIMEVAPVLTLGQITTALFEVGGKYRRSV